MNKSNLPWIHSLLAVLFDLKATSYLPKGVKLILPVSCQLDLQLSQSVAS